MLLSSTSLSRFHFPGRLGIAALVGSLALASCKPPPIHKAAVTQLEERRDGLTYVQGSDRLYSGNYLQLGRNSSKQEEWTYRDGLLDGANIRFNEVDGAVRRRIDYEKGVRVRKRCWYPNGQLRADETWRGEQISGMCTYWFDDGRIRKQLAFGDGFMAHGQVVEYDADGSLLIDAIMDTGRFVGGFVAVDKLDLSDKGRIGRRYFSDRSGSAEKEDSEKQVEKTAKL